MLCPRFILTDGESKRLEDGTYQVSWQSIVKNANPEYRIKPINPYRDFQAGGTTIYWGGKNRWISDKTILGRLCKWYFSEIQEV